MFRIHPDQPRFCTTVNGGVYITAAAEGERGGGSGAAADRQWYQYGRSQSLTKFNTPKIILPVLSTEPRYSYDDMNTIFTGGGNGPYYMVRPRPGASVSNHYLLAVLNHPLSEAFIRKNTSTFRGGYYSHGKQFIESLPVPLPPDAERIVIEELVRALIDALAAVADARTHMSARCRPAPPST